ncbi:MAG: alginate lyase family protein [Acidobacteriaceae bacterium]|nr:alginate lyase family protein [Acidobacteriaceae bacterium]
MRSPSEVAFRARQEAANVFLLATQPRFRGEARLQLALPDGRQVIKALRDSIFAAEVIRNADLVLRHEFQLFGCSLSTGPDIRWRHDYRHNRGSSTAYFRRIPYLSFDAVGDHKFVWELNRHQHLVLLAQAFLFSGNRRYLNEIFKELESWLEQNPFQRGINWASALEVGFRSLSWIWAYHFTASCMPDSFRRLFLTGLYRHGLHLAENLSIYFSPNTHLLGEAVALHALGTLFPSFPGAAKWRSRGAQVVLAQVNFQVRPDGSHFEQSSYYHIYALDLFLLFYVLAGRPAQLRSALKLMAEYLFWLLGPARRITFTGDDDGGRLFHPYGLRDSFGRATLATAGVLLDCPAFGGNLEDLHEQAVWWLGPQVLRANNSTPSRPQGSRLFSDSGTAFLQAGDLVVQIDAGPFGWGGAGHSHSDTLNVIVWFNGERVFVDPGTYTYVADPQERDWFRGSGAHNTIRIDGLDQAIPSGPFRWASKPKVSLNAWKPDRDGGLIDASCHYREFSHRRRVLLRPNRLLVFDEVQGSGRHSCEQIWQLGPAAGQVNLSFSAPKSAVESKFSSTYGAKCPGQSLVSTLEGDFPLQMATLLEVGSREGITVERARQILGD